MNKWVAAALGAIIAYGIAAQWPEIERYRRLRAM